MATSEIAKEARTQSHSLVFCGECGTLLDPPQGNEVHVACHACGSIIGAGCFECIQVQSYSDAKAFPARPTKPGVYLDGSQQVPGGTVEEQGKNSTKIRHGATIKEKCPNIECDATEMSFHAAQLRSADEGQTVFYTCFKCGYKYKVNS